MAERVIPWYIDYLTIWFYFFLGLKVFFVFLNIAGWIDIFIDMICLTFFTIWYSLEALLRWVIPRRRKDISGQTAVVTGAGHGIGKLIAIGLAKKGVKVVLWDINKGNIDSVAKEIEQQKGQAFSYQCDVSKKEEVHETARKVQLEVGHIDILVNNAGVVTGKKLLDCSDDDISRTMDVNVMAHFWTLKAFLGPMMEKNRGNIVAIASIMGNIGSPRLVDYCTSKSAVIRMMEALRQEVMWESKDGVFLTTVLPTKVDTGMFDGAQGRFSLVPPTVHPEYVARKVIDAIQRDEVFVILPPWLSFLFCIKPFLPPKLLDEALEFLGIGMAMNGFKGRKPGST